MKKVRECIGWSIPWGLNDSGPKGVLKKGAFHAVIHEAIPSMEMNTELVCVMASLGYADGEDYFKGVDCLESLKDMIRFLRHEDLQICNIRRQMGHAKVLQNDLLPLLTNYPENKELVDIVLRLLVNLTSAPELCFNQNPAENLNATERKTFEMQLISYLQSYKEVAFTKKTALSTIGSHFARILQLESMEREEEDVLLLERVLLLIRNLLFVPSNPEEEKRTDDDVTIHDQLLWNLHMNGIDDLLIYLSSSADEGNWCMHALEIISHMFREQNAEELARTTENRSKKEKEQDVSKIAAILAREKAEKEKQIQVRGARHSRFGGSFWIKDRKALKNDEDLVYHRPLPSAKNLTHDYDKKPERKRVNKRPLQNFNKERKSTLSVRIFLKEFCIKFLEHGYNNLLLLAKGNLDAGRTQTHDETYYIIVMRFFMAFNRVRSFRVEFVSQTFGIDSFNFIQNLTLKYLDMYGTAKVKRDKVEKLKNARRLELALSAYKELLMYVAIMAKSQDNNFRKAANVLQSNIFYTEEYRYLFIGMLRQWNIGFQTRSFLKDVVEAFHVYLKLFEAFLKDKGTFLARTKGISRRVKKKPRPQSQRCPIDITGEQAENLWQDTVSVELSACLQGRERDISDHGIIPFDPLSDVPVEDQVTMAFANIQRLLRCDNEMKAIAYLRASRECWPDERRFGTANMSIENEFMCLREAFFMELPLDVLQQVDAKLNEDDTPNELVAEEVDLKLNAMLFQLSVFITFKNILNEPITEEHKEIRGFAKHIISNFFELYAKKPEIVLEALFWKENIECYTITEDEDFLQRHRKKSKTDSIGKWTFEEEEELIELYEQLKDEHDAIEKIAEKIEGKERTPQQISNKLRRLRIIDKPRKRKLNEWTENETEELRRVFEEFKESDDPLGNIMSSISFRKGKKWIDETEEHGFATQVEWVQGRLKRLANEREHVEEEQWQSVPLVPITEDHENAMESRLFKRMLKQVGVSPPATEQESFWRISRTLSPAELRICVQDLEKPTRPGISTKRMGATKENRSSAINANTTNNDENSDDDDYYENFIAGHKMNGNVPSTSEDMEDKNEHDEVEDRSDELIEDENLVKVDEDVSEDSMGNISKEQLINGEEASINGSAKEDGDYNEDEFQVEQNTNEQTSTENDVERFDSTENEMNKERLALKRNRDSYDNDDGEDDGMDGMLGDAMNGNRKEKKRRIIADEESEEENDD
eukprot:gene3457-3953_t